MPISPLLNQIANAFLQGERSAGDTVDRLAALLGRRWRFLTPLVERYLRAFPLPRPRRREVLRFLREDRVFQRAWRQRFSRIQVNQWPASPPPPQNPFAGWDLPAIQTAGDLAAWLELTPRELDWYADLKGI